MQLLNRKTISRSLIVFPLALLLLAGCSRTGEEPALFGYLDSPATFTVVFPPLDDTAVPVSCEGRLSPDEITLTVTDPPRSAGLIIRYSGGACTMESGDGGTPVPLSEKAAEPLTVFLRVLTTGADAADRKKSPDGQETLLVCPDGVLHLNDAHLPAAVESGLADGGSLTRTVTITNWRQEENGS